MSMDDILSSADCQILVKYALDSIKAQENEKFIPGCVSAALYHGESIIHATINANIIKNMYTLHDKVHLFAFRARFIYCQQMLLRWSQT
jgi:hypothetical protein